MSKPDVKLISSLRVQDIEKYAVWQFTPNHEYDDTAVQPIKRLPVANLAGKVVGCPVQLANGESCWGLLGNLHANNTKLNQHFLTLSLERKGRWFHLARYHDFDYDDRGPEALARFLGLGVDDVFPILYDVRKYVRGNPAALAGNVLKEPSIRLTREEIIALAVPTP